MICGFDPWPSTRRVGGCAVSLIHVTLVGAVAYVCVLVVATTVGAWLHRGPDPRLLRAACASKTAADAARSMASVMTFQRESAREIVATVRMATEAETRAWDDADVGCE